MNHAVIGSSSMNRAFCWHKSINRGINCFLQYFPSPSIESRLENFESVVFAQYLETQETNLENFKLTPFPFQMARSPSILILLLALASALQPQELSIEDIVNGKS